MLDGSSAAAGIFMLATVLAVFPVVWRREGRFRIRVGSEDVSSVLRKIFIMLTLTQCTEDARIYFGPITMLCFNQLTIVLTAAEQALSVLCFSFLLPVVRALLAIHGGSVLTIVSLVMPVCEEHPMTNVFY
mmetsp:Transcript_6346/g.23463  ORF Transcript_6346/g.23463 Transcript_6346/m.23463 type:complete len:131 (-) Transcript_6346:412-804(-)